MNIPNKIDTKKIGETMTGFYQKHPLISHLILIFVTGVFLVLLSQLFLDIWTEHGKTAVVPDIKGVSYNTAAGLLAENGLGIEVTDSVYDSASVPGTVTESWPRPRTTVKPGRTVYVTINALMPRQVQIATPLKDVSSRQAVAYLQGLGLKDVRIDYVPGTFDDLVQGVYYNQARIDMGSVIPVTASVRVVVTKAVSAESVSQAADSLSSDQNEVIE